MHRLRINASSGFRRLGSRRSSADRLKEVCREACRRPAPLDVEVTVLNTGLRGQIRRPKMEMTAEHSAKSHEQEAEQPMAKRRRDVRRRDVRRRREAMSQEPTAIPNIMINIITLIILIAPAMSFANAVNTCVHPGEEGRARGRRTPAEGGYVAGAHRNSKYDNKPNPKNINRSSDVICQCGEYLCTPRGRRPSSRKKNDDRGRLCRRSPPQFQI